MFGSVSTSDISSRKLPRIFLCIAVILLAIASVQAEKFTVCEEGCSYTNITAGIAAAKPGDVLEVQSGTYRENVNVTKSIILRGIDTGKGRPLVDAGQKGSAITLSTDGITVDGFEARTAVGNPFGEWAGIRIASNDNIISNNLATDNDNGIFLTNFANNTLSGNNATRNINGIRVVGSKDNTVKANYLSGNNYGLLLTSSANNNLTANRATDNDYGISLESSEGNMLSDNRMYGNSYNFGADGINNVSTSNLVDGRPVYYLVKASGDIINSSTQAGTVYCIECTNVTIRDLTVENSLNGIFLRNTTNSRLENNSLRNNSYGIRLIFSPSNAIRDNSMSNNLIDGISLDSSDNNTVENNTALQNHHYGLSILYSVGNTIEGNNASINDNGLGINYSSGSIILRNTLGFNKNNGLMLKNSGQNNISLNTLNNNSKGAWLISSAMNAISDNDVIGNIDGIRLEFSKNNTISGNKISGNDNGIVFDPMYANKISDNNKLLGNKENRTTIVSMTTAAAPGPHISLSDRVSETASTHGEEISQSNHQSSDQDSGSSKIN